VTVDDVTDEELLGFARRLLDGNWNSEGMREAVLANRRLWVMLYRVSAGYELEPEDS